MRIRTIKPEFWRSPDVLALSLFERLLFIGLWNLADDEGRGRYEPAAIAADLFLHEYSLNPHGVLTEVSNAFDKYQKQEMLAVYEVGNRRFFEILRWSDHQKISRPSSSKIPSRNIGSPAGSEIHGGLTEDSVSAHGGLTAGKEQGTGKGTGKGTPQKPPKGQEGPKHPDAFQRFWDSYGKKVDRPASIRAWDKALKKTEAETIITSATQFIIRQRANGKHPQYTPNPATWLNREGWNDDLPPVLAQEHEAQGYTASDWDWPTDDPVPYVEAEIVPLRGIGQ